MLSYCIMGFVILLFHTDVRHILSNSVLLHGFVVKPFHFPFPFIWMTARAGWLFKSEAVLIAAGFEQDYRRRLGMKALSWIADVTNVRNSPCFGVENTSWMNMPQIGLKKVSQYSARLPAVLDQDLLEPHFSTPYFATEEIWHQSKAWSQVPFENFIP